MQSTLLLFGKEIPLYSVFIFLGIAAAMLLLWWMDRRLGLDFDDSILIACYSGSLGMLGAKLLYLFVMRNHIDWTQFWKPAVFDTWMRGGFVFYGGLIAGALGLLLACRIHHIALWKHLPAVCAALPLAHAFGRIGCFFVGCCYGIPFESSWSVTYITSLFAPNNIPLLPVQLIEAGFDLVLVGLLVWLNCKKAVPLVSMALYMGAYGTFRFGMEFLRNDPQRGTFLAFSTSQWISLVLIVGACSLLLLQRRLKKYVSRI